MPAEFTTSGNGYHLSVRPLGISLQLGRGGDITQRGNAIGIQFEGANPKAWLEPLERQAGVSNYLIGNDPKQWRTNVPRYNRVMVHSLYPGIDVVYYGNQGQLEYDFLLAPHTDPGRIRLRIEGGAGMRLEANGDLALSTGSQSLRQRKPVLYQDRDGKRVPVQGRYVQLGEDEIAFQVEEFDRTQALVIDPVLSFSTYFGTGQGCGIAVDNSGYVYVTGSSGSVGSPPGVFVAKLNPATSQVVYATYFGADGSGNAIAVDPAGEAYVAGYINVYAGLPLVNPLQSAFKPGYYVSFLLKLNAAGNAPLFSTYWGGTFTSFANAIALGSAGKVYIAGQTASPDLQVKNAYQPSLSGITDGYVAEFDTSAASLVFSTYLGGSGDDFVKGLGVDSSSNIWLTGQTGSYNDFPVAAALLGPPGVAYAPPQAFLSKLDSSGSKLLFSTYLTNWPYAGSSGMAIATDSAGNTYVAGGVDDGENLPLSGELQGYSEAAGTSCFITKFSSANAIVFSTLLSSTGSCRGLALGPQGKIAVTGEALIGWWLPIVDPVQAAPGNSSTGFVTVLANDGSVIEFSTFLGSMSYQSGLNAIAADANGNLYVTGYSSGDGYPEVAPVSGYADSRGVVVSQIQPTTSCTFQVSPATLTASASATTQYGYISVTAPPGCVWNATGADVVGQPNLAGPTTVYRGMGSDIVTVAVNFYSYADQTRNIIAAGHKVTLKLKGWGCSYSLQSSEAYFAAQGGSGSFGVNATGDCTYSASTTYSWITITSPYGPAKFTVAANSGPPRQGTITAAGLTFTVYQDGQPVPVLSVSKTHTGNFTQGQTGATYTVVISNAVGAIATSGAVTVTDTVPLGMTLVSMSGTGWACPGTGGANSCTRSDPLNAGAAYPAITVTVNVAPDAPAQVTNQVSVTGSGFASASASDSTTITERFPNVPSVVSGTPTTSAGSTQTFTFTVRDADGASDIAVVYFLINPNLAVPQATCHGFYVRGSNALYLYNDTLSALIGPLAPGAPGTLQNSQCTVYGNTSSVGAGTGTDLAINIGLGLQSSYAAGAKNVYLLVVDNEGHNSGWVQTGSWTVGMKAAVPVAVSGSPASATATPQTFTFTGRDSDGYTDIAGVYFLVNSSLSIPQATCLGLYVRASNALYLYNDTLTVPMGPLTPGSGGTLQNSQCMVYGATSSVVSAAGTDVTVNVGLGLQPGYSASPKNVYLFISDNEGHNSGWAQTSVWNVALSPSPVTMNLTSSQNPSVYGQPVMLTATVLPASATGLITFYDDVTVLGSKPLVAGSTSFGTVLLPSGTRKLRAYYSGDTRYNPATSQVLSQAVNTTPAFGLLTASTLTTLPASNAVAVADFDGDGKADVALSIQGAANILVLLGNGDGTFKAPKSYATAIPTWIAAGDFNGDGKQDLAATTGLNSSVSILLGNGDGTFQNAVNYPVGGDAVFVAVADFNGDGKADLAVANRAGSVSILLGRGDGTFRTEIDQPISNPSALALGDWNGDGIVDLAVATNSGVTILVGNGDGTFQAGGTLAAGIVCSAVTAADFDGDGKMDLAVADGVNGFTKVFLGNGDGSFKAPVNNPGGGPVTVAGDFNGDGKADLVIGGQYDDHLTLLLGNGDGTFGGPNIIFVEEQAVAAADFNGDGRTDLAVAGSGSFTAMLGGWAAFSISSSHAGNFVYGQTGAYTLRVTNGAAANPSSGLVTVTETLPDGLTLVSMTGTGWSCSGAVCTRSDALAPGDSYPPITVTVSVPPNAPATGTNQVSISGGGSVSGGANDITIINAVPSVVSGTPPAATANPQSFTFTVHDADGASDIAVVYFLINPNLAVPQATCHGFYVRGSNALYLYNDTLSALIGPLAPGASGTLANSQCTVYGNTSSVGAGTGMDLAINIGLGLQSSYAAGAKNVYLLVVDNEGHNSGWVQTGSWTVGMKAAVPVAVSGSPASATATPQTFAFTGRDSDGYADIAGVYFLVNSSLSIPQATCLGLYVRASNALYLYNDTLTVPMGPLTPGSGGTLQNGQCVVYGASSSLVSAAGTDVTVNVGLGLQPGYAASPKNVYLYISDNEGHNSGWMQTGTWALPARNTAPSVVSGSPATSSTTPQTFTVTVRDGDGYGDVNNLYFLVNSGLNISQATCLGLYVRSSNALYLYNDALTTPMGPLTPGSGGTLQNSQCVVYGATSSLIAAAGTDITLNLGLGLQASYGANSKNVYVYVDDMEGHNSGWVQTGSWIVAPKTAAPVVVSGTPANTSTAQQTFTFTARDADGYNDLNNVYFLVNPGLAISQGTCLGLYVRASNALYLYSDNLTVPMGPLIPGSGGTLQNSQCIVSGSTSSLVSTSGTDLTINVGLGLQPSYGASTKAVYLYVDDLEGHNSGWVKTGTWAAH
jgi:uncharacterized repeat protein (TIGR01451 family)